MRREQLRRDGNLNGCDGAHRHTQPLKRISFIIKWLYLFQFFCICCEGLNIHFIHHRLQKHFSSLATYHHSRTEDSVSQSFLCCICFFISFAFDLHISLYFFCICFVFPLYHHSGAQGGLSHNFLCCALRGAPVNIGRLVRCAQ